MKLFTVVAAAIICCQAAGQTDNGMIGHLRALDDAAFESCDVVHAQALERSHSIKEAIYFMELFPKSRGALQSLFGSEGTGQAAARWISKYRPEQSPYALFYFVNGKYTLRCRDIQNRFVELSGPGGSPLALKSPVANSKIWHFYFTPINAAHVFVVTSAPLDTLDGEALMAEVQERLQARLVYLYVRNDPWFLGVAPNPVPYILADSYKRLTEEQYQASRTLTCYSTSRCRLGPSVLN
jgi:hypothetical protein